MSDEQRHKKYLDRQHVIDGTGRIRDRCVPDVNGQMIDDGSEPTAAWITAVGVVLATASLLAIGAIIVLYVHDYRQGTGAYLLFPRRPTFDLRRVPSDMVHLIGGAPPKSMMTVQATTAPVTSILATGARTNRALVDMAPVHSRTEPKLTQKLVRFDDEHMQPIEEEDDGNTVHT